MRRAHGGRWIDQVVKVLREADRPLHESEIASLIVESGFPTAGQTPDRTVSRTLTQNKARFEYTAPGTYRLKRRYWALSATPDDYDLTLALGSRVIDEWTIKKNDVRFGDRVLLWQLVESTNDQRGIAALGQVSSDPHYVDSDSAGSKELRVDIRYVRTLSSPLWLSPSSRFDVAMFSGAPDQGTVLSMSDEQWDVVLSSVGGWPVESPELQQLQDDLEPVSRKPTSRQVFSSSPEARRKVELYAMSLARDRLQSENWLVNDVSATHCYDFHCSHATKGELRVEVKGTTGGGDAILLTRNEVEHARSFYPGVALIVVSDIRLSVDQAGFVHADGGEVRLISPWELVIDRLQATAYSYRIDESSGSR
jgi:hypothetical protein